MNKKKICAVMALAMTITLSTKGITAMASIDEGAGQESGGGMSSQQGSNIQDKKVRISSVTVDKDTVEPGKPFTLTFRVENISGGRIDGLSLKVVNVEGKGTLEPFIPVGTTNEIYVGNIAYNDAKDVSITLSSAPTLKEGVYNFVTSVMYSQWGNPEEEITKLVGVVAQNPPVLSVSDVNCDGGVVGGSLYNGGTARINNIKAKVTLNGEIFEQVIGNLEVEDENYIDISLPKVEKDTQAEVEVVYEDGTGKEYSIKSTVNVSSAPVESQLNNNGANEEEQGFWVSLWDKIKSIFGFGD